MSDMDFCDLFIYKFEPESGWPNHSTAVATFREWCRDNPGLAAKKQFV
jgi:hypothetical protein